MKTSKQVIYSRQEEILNFLQNHNYCKLSELSDHFKVSSSTIRRDIEQMSKSGIGVKCRGGICIKNAEKALPKFDDERFQLSHSAEKEAIAKKTAELIEDGDTVLMNASSTVLRILPYIHDKNVTIITNNGRMLFAKRNPGTDLIIVGGEVPPVSSASAKLSMTGDITIETISRISATKCILGVSGISADSGLTSMSLRDPPINRNMIRQCTGKVIIAADHRKIGIQHNFNFTTAEKVDILVTDDSSDEVELQKLREKGIEVHKVKV